MTCIKASSVALILVALLHSTFADDLEIRCVTEAGPGRETFECESNHRLTYVVCSLDGGPPESCSFPLVVEIGRFGTEKHTIVVTVIDVHSHRETLTFNFQLTKPPLELKCDTEAVPGRQTFDCESSNQLLYVLCRYDGTEIEDCSFPVVVGFDRFGTEKHTVEFAVYDEFQQVESVLFNFQLLEPLEVKCVTETIPGRQTFECESNYPLESVVCSFDGGRAESCSFPLVVKVDKFGTEEHTVVVTATDVFGESKLLSFNFQLTVAKQPRRGK